MRLVLLLVTVLIATAVVYEQLPLLWVIVALFIAVCAVLPLGIHAFCYARRRVVTCPGSGGPAEIEVQASGSSGAGFTVTNCSLWYKASGCNRSCAR